MISTHFITMLRLIVKQMGLPEFKPVSKKDYKALAIIGIIKAQFNEEEKQQFEIFENLLLPNIASMLYNEDTIEKIIEILKDTK